jgi:hypothetical protein
MTNQLSGISEAHVTCSYSSRNQGEYRLQGLLHPKRCAGFPLEPHPVLVDACYIRRIDDQKYLVSCLYHHGCPEASLH